MNKKGMKIMAVILAGLLVITVIVSLSDNKKAKGNFKSTLAELDITNITGIEISLPSGDQGYKLTKSDAGQWEIDTGSGKYRAQNSGVSSFLNQSLNLKVKQVVAREKKDWEKFSVNDSMGSILRFYQDDKLLDALVIGRMSFSQPTSPYQRQPNAYTYIREKEGKIVYSVEGMLGMMLSRGIEFLRDGTIISLNKNDVNRISLNYPSDSSFVLSKPDSTWNLNGMPVDSATMENYLNILQNNSIQNFEPAGVIEGQNYLWELLVEGNNMSAVSVKAWEGNEPEKYFVTSSLNPGTVFSFDQTRFESLFKSRNKILDN